MTQRDPISDEQLNALLDNELDAAESERLLQEIHTNKIFAQRYCELRQIKDLAILAYQEVPMPRRSQPQRKPRLQRHVLQVASVAAAMMLVAMSTVTIMNAQYAQSSVPIKTLAQFDPAAPLTKKILLHVSSLDAQRVNAALDTAEKLVSTPRADAGEIQVEIVANAEGLGVLRTGSPYADRIRSLASTHDNLIFSACANTKHMARLREGNEIPLLPEAHEVPNALDQILKRLADGWLYVRV